jgi:hypothetical protein
VLDIGETKQVEWKLGAVCTVHGRVLDEQSNPITGVEVCITPSGTVHKNAVSERPTYFLPGMAGVAGSDTSVSDEAGHYRFNAVSPGRWRLGPAARFEASAVTTESRWAPLAEAFDVPDDARSIERDIVVHVGSYVRGKVVDPKGSPVQTLIHLQTADGAFVWIHSGDENGNFAAGPIVPGEYKLTASAYGFFAASNAVEVRAGDENVVLTLQPGASLAATIVDDESGERIPGHVFLTRHGAVDLAHFPGDSSRDPTAVLLHGIGAGVYDLVARTSDGRVGLLREIELRAGSQADVVVRVARGAKVRVRCDGPAPWGGYVVRAGDARLAQGSLARGGIEVVDVPPGRISVEFSPTDTDPAESQEIDVRAGDQREVVFRDKN